MRLEGSGNMQTASQEVESERCSASQGVAEETAGVA